LFASAFLPAKKRSPDKVKVIEAENINGELDSLYIRDTGMQKRYANVSIRSILLNILRINSGLISFIMGHRKFKATNISRNNSVLFFLQLNSLPELFCSNIDHQMVIFNLIFESCLGLKTYVFSSSGYFLEMHIFRNI